MLGKQFVHSFNGKIKFLNCLNLLILTIIGSWFGNLVLKKYTGTFLPIVVRCSVQTLNILISSKLFKRNIDCLSINI